MYVVEVVVIVADVSHKKQTKKSSPQTFKGGRDAQRKRKKDLSLVN